MTPISPAVKVLVVDQDEDTLELLGEYLHARGMEVLTAYAPEEAVALARSVPIDVVFVELTDSGGGIALVHAARTRAVPAAVVISLTHDSIDLAVTCMKAGASDVIRKPYRLQAIFSALQSAIDDRSQILQARAASERLLFYEAAAELVDISGVSRLFGLLAQVAWSECRAEEVAVWQLSPGGWSAVARGGRVDLLAQFDPERIAEDGGIFTDSVAAVPVRTPDGECRAVVAVAGGPTRDPGDTSRLQQLARVSGEAIARCDSSAPTS